MAMTNAPNNGDRPTAGSDPGTPHTATDPAKVDGSEPPKTEVAGSPEQWATVLRETIPSRFMYASMIKPFGVIDEHAYKAFRDRLIADCGSPSDPIEVMVIEQLALAHLNMGFLQCRAANAPTLEAVGVYGSAAARLMAEFRRSALALQAYRAASRQLASDPTQDVVIPAAQPDESPGNSGKKGVRRRTGSGRRGAGGRCANYSVPRVCRRRARLGPDGAGRAG